MQTFAATGLRAQLPCRAAKAGQLQRMAISCRAAPQRQQQPAYQASAATSLALSSLMLGLGSAPAWADDSVVGAAADSVGAAAADASSAAGGVTLAGWTLVLSPILFYVAFNVYRSQVDPKARFGDAIFVLAALVIVSNIISITVFKIRLW